jgi:FAD/FMN-containing dehydrogenase
MTSVPSLSSAVAELVGRFSGQLLQPSDAGYEEARRVHNGLVDKRPALIARCRGVADVVDAVNLAKQLGLEVAVRGGGHNVAGRATVEGGLMIDLATMKGIQVDRAERTVRAQGGVTWPSSTARRSFTAWRSPAAWSPRRESPASPWAEDWAG